MMSEDSAGLIRRGKRGMQDMGILCIGEMLIDFTPVVTPAGNAYMANPGGAPANVAVSAARNGIEAGFLGKLGNDDFGRLLLNTLKENNVEVLLPTLTDEATTTLAFVTLDDKGDRSFTFARKPGADMLLSEEEVEKADITKWDIVHAGSVRQSGAAAGKASSERDAVLKMLKKAKDAGKLVSFDINYRDKIWSVEECLSESEKIYPLTDLMKISEEELVFVGGIENSPAFMKEYGISVIALTRGGDGARVYYNCTDKALNAEEGWRDTGDGRVFCTDIESMKVEHVVDTTGAGDAYWGGFLSALVRQGIRQTSDITMDKLCNALRYGAVSGGLCIQKSGGIPAIPAREEIEEVLKTLIR